MSLEKDYAVFSLYFFYIKQLHKAMRNKLWQKFGSVRQNKSSYIN